MGDNNTNTQPNYTKLHNTLDSPRNGSLQNESQGGPVNTLSAAGPSGQPLPPTLPPEPTQQDLPSITENPKFEKITKEQARNQQSEEFKIVFLGAEKVGKSSIIRRFIDDIYIEDLVTQSTILEKKLLFCRRAEDNKVFKIIVCDIGNQDDVDEVEAGIFDQCQVVVIVFDVARDVTLKVAKRDLLKVKDKVGNYPTKFLLAGNKCDLSKYQDVSETMRRGRTLANDFDMQYFKTSAKDDNIEITQLFDKVVKKAIEAKNQFDREERNRNQNVPAEVPAPDLPRNNNNGSSCALL